MIRIICVGRLKEEYWKGAVSEYLKRLSKYVKIEVIEVLDEGVEDSTIALKKEKERIEKYINHQDFVVTLEIEGKEFTSLEFSKKIEEWQMHYSNITFIIGGSFGLAAEIKNRSNFNLSFSKMTFPHQLFRIILLEQIYRSYKILNNEKYHK